MSTSMEELVARVQAMEERNAEREAELNSFYLMWAGALIFLMQSGFAVLSAGSIRSKNVKNILLKNLLDACIGAVTWYLLGYGFAYDLPNGDYKPNAFIGGSPGHFAISDVNDKGDSHEHGYDWISFFFQYTFAAAAATIVSGAVAERCKLVAYLIYTFFITGFIYPVVVHWVWDGNGFLCAFNDASTTTPILTGMIDFAGSGVVHMTGGWAAMMGALVLGPRIGRFEEGVDQDQFSGHSATLQVLGTFILWFGWYGFNPGSTLAVHSASRDMARVAVTTTLSAATGGITGLFSKKYLPKSLGGSGIFDISHTCNALLGGLVGITASCAVVDPWGAIIVGFVAAFVYHGGSCAMRKFKIDDPLDAFAVHGACGVWGCLSVGVLAAKEYSYAPAEGNEYRKGSNGTDLGPDAGIFMEGSRGELFATQLVGVIIIVLWVCSLSGLLFLILKKTGMLRVDENEEAMGADIAKHGGHAYPESIANRAVKKGRRNSLSQMLGLVPATPSTATITKESETTTMEKA